MIAPTVSENRQRHPAPQIQHYQQDEKIGIFQTPDVSRDSFAI